MFNVTLRLRSLNEPCKPTGPNFSSAPSYRFSIGEAVVSVVLPRHRTARSSKQTKPPKAYSLEPRCFQEFDIDKKGWQFQGVLYRLWDFYGPNFTGMQATADVSIGVFSPNDADDIDLLSAKGLEGVITKYLDCSYADNLFRGRQSWFAPHCWEPLAGNGLGVKFDVLANKKAHNARKHRRFVVFPVSPKHLLVFEFRLEWSPKFGEDGKPCEIEDENWIDISNMNALVDDIVNSISVEYPEDIKRQIEASIAQDGPLSETYAPLRWESHELSV